MSTNITEAFYRQVGDNLELLTQQQGSKFRPMVMTQMLHGEGSKLLDQVGEITATQLTARHADTVYGNVAHTSRHAFPLTFTTSELIDKKDQLEMLIQPTSAYAQAMGYALGRKLDAEIIRALTGVAKTGKNGASNTALPTAQKIVHGGVGLTVEKLIETRMKFVANDVDLDRDTLYMAIGHNQLGDLLNSTKVGSSDYNQVMALMSGKVNQFMGITFVNSQLLPKAGTTRTNVAWTKRALVAGIWADSVIRIDELPEKNYSTQVYAAMTFGASRTEEKRVVAVECTE